MPISNQSKIPHVLFDFIVIFSNLIFFQLRGINLNKFTSCYDYYYNEKSHQKVMLTNLKAYPYIYFLQRHFFSIVPVIHN